MRKEIMITIPSHIQEKLYFLKSFMSVEDVKNNLPMKQKEENDMWVGKMTEQDYEKYAVLCLQEAYLNRCYDSFKVREREEEIEMFNVLATIFWDNISRRFDQDSFFIMGVRYGGHIVRVQGVSPTEVLECPDIDNSRKINISLVT